MKYPFIMKHHFFNQSYNKYPSTEIVEQITAITGYALVVNCFSNVSFL